MHEQIFLKMRYDKDTLDGLFNELEQALIRTFSTPKKSNPSNLINYLNYLSYQGQRDFIDGLRQVSTLDLDKNFQGKNSQKVL